MAEGFCGLIEYIHGMHLRYSGPQLSSPPGIQGGLDLLTSNELNMAEVMGYHFGD